MARKIHISETETGLPIQEDAVIREAVKSFQASMVALWIKIRKAREESDDATASVSFTVKMIYSGKRPVVKTALRCKNKATVHERDSIVEDPNQEVLPI